MNGPTQPAEVEPAPAGQPSPRRHVVELPLPYRECSPNYRGHTKVRARKVAAYRQACFYAIRKAGLGPMPAPVTLHLEFFLARPATLAERYKRADLYFPLDDDDAIGSFKPGRDALADVGIVKADTKRYVRQGSCHLYTRAEEHRGRCCLVLTIEEAR